jgi:acyl-CoA reductase-like NAD-dependent aldehyde dehydrogenase
MDTAIAQTSVSQLPVRNPRTGEIDMYITPPSLAEIAATCARLREKQDAWGARRWRTASAC